MQTINESFLTTVSTSDLTKVTLDLTEVAFDSILEDGVLKDVPVISSLIGIYKGVVTMREQLFAKKVIKFLTSLSTVSIEEREQMFIKLEKNGEKRQKVGEAILLTLEQLDDFNKATLLGTLMKSLSKSIIEYDDFLRFSSILNRSFIQDLMQLPSFVNSQNSKVGSILYSLGLLTPVNYFANDTTHDQNEYRLSELGLLFCRAIEIMP